VRPRLVALDVDGTIVHEHGKLAWAQSAPLPSPKLGAAIRSLVDAGIVVVLASGRMFPGTARVARHLGLDTPMICQQGCSVHRPDGTMLHQFPIERPLAMDIVDYARQIDRAYEWFNPVRYVVSRPTPEAEEYGRVSGITPEYRPDPENSGATPTGVGIISTPREAPAIHRAVVSRHAETLHVLDFPAVTVAVAPEANKGHALSLVCDDLRIDRHETLAIGDSVNDAPMLAWAGRGIALSHGDRYAIDAADEVLDMSEHDALAELLELIAAAGERRASTRIDAVPQPH
jgi:hydroxymethylpyrimidine pyrophosphatase-like HAD family hydrolase